MSGPGGTCLVQGVSGLGVVSGPGRSGRGGAVPGQILPPPVNRMTHTCKNITLATTSFRPVIKEIGPPGWEGARSWHLSAPTLDQSMLLH